MPLDARRHLLPLIAAVLLAIAFLAGCGGNDGEAEGGTTGGAFPVTIQHALGTTEIPAEPTRVVALGQTDPDTALALGVTPVGAREAFSGGLETWITDALGGAEPDLLNVNAGVPFEQVAALDTLDADVLLMVYGGDAALRGQLEANPVYRRLDAVRRGDDVAVPLELAVALRSPSSLSLPWSLEQLIPELEGALRS
jgi:ABC-type Fe3+-hydroxamate transport system substrate-binding protein